MKKLFKKKALMIAMFLVLFAVGVTGIVIKTTMDSNAKDISSSNNASKEKKVEASEKPLDSEKSKDDKVVKKEDKDAKKAEVAKDENKDKPVVVDTVDNGKKKAYLTFDDGPSDATPKILNILDRYNVKATFFVTNQFGQSDSEYKAISDKGHTVALHTASHNWSIYKSKEAYYKDLNKMSDIVERATGKKSNIVRFPGGSNNAVSKKQSTGIMTELTKDLPAKGYKYFDWNVNDGDSDKPKMISKEQVVSNVKREAASCGEKDVCILMHDTSYKTKRTTVEALPEIIEYLKGAGYEILPITESTKEVHFSKLNN